MTNLQMVRNIGISAHIDSGKTTLSERILFYSGRIHKMEEVRGDGSGATMDHMELEKERGITITSAATTVNWDDYEINLIDTPGHVDFTVEVERSLRVLDGAVLVLCSVGGVQSQSMTVDRQMKRYHVPRIAFVNKMDRTGANPLRVCEEMREKLNADAILMQLPMGSGETFEGVIDLVEMKAVYFDGDNGEKIRREDIPQAYQDQADKARTAMLEQLAMYSDEMMELLLSEEPVSSDLIHEVHAPGLSASRRNACLAGNGLPQQGVCNYCWTRSRGTCLHRCTGKSPPTCSTSEEKLELTPDNDKPFVGMAFKIVDDPFGQLTYNQIYQGTAKKGQDVHQSAHGSAKNDLAASCGCTRISVKKSTRPALAISWRSWESMRPAAIRTLRRRSTARWKACLFPHR